MWTWYADRARATRIIRTGEHMMARSPATALEFIVTFDGGGNQEHGAGISAIVKRSTGNEHVAYESISLGPWTSKTTETFGGVKAHDMACRGIIIS